MKPSRQPPRWAVPVSWLAFSLAATACIVNTPGYGLDGGGDEGSESSDADVGTGDDAGDGSDDADSGETGVSPDVGDGGVEEGCNELWHLGPQFESPEALVALNSDTQEMDPFLSADGTTLYFGSLQAGGPGGIDLWAASRVEIDAPFGAPFLNTHLQSSNAHEIRYAPFDELTVYVIAQWQGGAGDFDIWRADRDVESEPFEVFDPLVELNTAAAEYDVVVTEEGRRVYWTRSDGGAQSLFTATRADADSMFESPQPVQIDSPNAYDDSPALSSDELVIVFGSDRAGGLGGHDLWYATRDEAGDAFGSPVLLPSVNGSSSDAEAHLSADGCELFFVSDRPGSLGEWDLYRARVLEP